LHAPAQPPFLKEIHGLDRPDALVSIRLRMTGAERRTGTSSAFGRCLVWRSGERADLGEWVAPGFGWPLATGARPTGG
jgi:hypothetical protein